MNNIESLLQLIHEYISKTIQNVELMKTNIDFMSLFPDYEFYNIAAILMQRSNARFVKSKIAWEDYFNKSIYLARGSRAIRVLRPKIIDGNLDYDLIPVFDISDLNEKTRRLLVSKFKKTIDRLGKLDEIRKVISAEEWKSAIETKLSEDNRYLSFTMEQQEYIVNCLLYSTNSFIYSERKCIELNTNGEVAIIIYAFIKQYIDYLPDVFAFEFERLTAVEKEIKLKEQIAVQIGKNLKERIRDAKKQNQQTLLNVKYDNFGDSFPIPEPTEADIWDGDL